MPIRVQPKPFRGYLFDDHLIKILPLSPCMFPGSGSHFIDIATADTYGRLDDVDDSI